MLKRLLSTVFILIGLAILPSIAKAQNPPGGYLSNQGAGGGGGGSISPGTIGALSCYSSTTGVGPCPGGATDNGSTFNIPEDVTIGGGGGAGSFRLPAGLVSGCIPPALGSGVNLFCSVTDGTNYSFQASLDGASYIPLPVLSGSPTSGALAKFSSALQLTNGDLSGDASTAGSTVVTVSKINGGTYSGVSGNFSCFGVGNTPSDCGLSPSSLAPAPATQATVTGKNLCAYNQGTGAWTLCNLAPFSPITPAGDTLTNATLTTEQYFATSYTIPAGTITAQKEFTFNMGSDYVGTGTPATGTLRIRLCTTGLPTPAGCVIVFQSSAVAPGVNTRSSWIPLNLIGTAAAGASANVIAVAGNGQSITIWGTDLKGASTVVLNTSVQLFLVYSIQYANTTASSSLQLTALWANAGPLI